MSQIQILLVGNTNRDEFRRARAVLDSVGRVTYTTDAESAAEAINSGRLVPELIVIAQAYPFQFSHQAVDWLRRLAPLSRTIGLMGSWCEGEVRTGRPWPGAVRVYWHQWPPRCSRELGRMARGECSAWSLPPTATDEERLLTAADESPPARCGLIAIHTRRGEMEDWLSAACRSRGYSTVWLRPQRPAKVEGAAAAIFNGTDLRGDELDELKRLSSTLAQTPIVAMLDFPRVETSARAMAAGATAVVSKPSNLDDLFWELDRVLNV